MGPFSPARSSFGGKSLSLARIRVRADFINRYEAHSVGGSGHPEYRIPAADLAAFNAAIVGEIEITAEFRRNRQSEAL